MAKDNKGQKEKLSSGESKSSSAKKSVSSKKKAKRIVSAGIVHIHASLNNTIILVTDFDGNRLIQTSSGGAGFSGSRKHTPYAAQIAAERAALRAIEELKMEKVEVRVKGPGPGRESAIRALDSKGLQVTNMKDVTPIPHNGCQAPKRRRI